MLSAREKTFRRISQFSFFHYKRLLLLTLLLAILSLFQITRLQMQSDVINLLPAHAPKTEAFVNFLKEFGTADSLFIVLERKSDGEVESFAPFAEVFAGQLNASGEFKEIYGRVDKAAQERIEKQFIKKALLYLSEADLQKMESKLSLAAIEQRVGELRANLHSPLGSWTSQWAAGDPLNMWPLFQKHIPVGSNLESQGYLLSEDGKMMLLIAKPKGLAPDIRYDEMLLEKVRFAERAAQEAFARGKNLDPATYFQDLRIGLAGGYMTALEDSRTIRKELIMNFSVSLIGVLAIFFFAFGKGMAILYAIFPLAVSPLLTLGLFSPFLGRLSEVTGAFSAIILGLSIDFIILIYGRYLEERSSGLDIQESLGRSLGRMGPSVFIGAVTTTAAYFALLLSDFRGIKELGLLTGTGILISMLCTFFLFPAMVAWREKKKPEKRLYQGVFAFGLEQMGKLSWKSPSWILLLCAVMTMITTAFAFQVKLSNDPRKLRPAGHPSLALEERMQEKMGEGQETIVVLAKSPSAEEALEVQGRLKSQFAQALSSGLPISRYESLASFLPPLSQQKRNLQWIMAREKDSLNPQRVERDLKAALQREGLRVQPFGPGLMVLREMLENRELLTWENFQEYPLHELSERFLKKKGGAFISAAYLQVKADFWLNPQGQAFLEDLKKSAPEVQVTGSKLVQTELEKIMGSESWKILLIALAAVFGLIYLDFRSWRLAFLSLLPVVLASIWTLGLMGMLGMNLNFMNLMVFTMVLGIGVDYGVHILHRGLESSKEELRAGLAQVSKGVIVAALTTLVGFGSLILSGYPGLQSMGAVAIMGVGFSALISLTLVPVLLQKWLAGKKEEDPNHE